MEIIKTIGIFAAAFFVWVAYVAVACLPYLLLIGLVALVWKLALN